MSYASSTCFKSRSIWKPMGVWRVQMTCPASKTSANSASPSWPTVSVLYLTLSVITCDSIVARWERKGKLKKKSLNKDVFKERYFELVRDNLYYYKSEKDSKSHHAILSDTINRTLLICSQRERPSHASFWATLTSACTQASRRLQPLTNCLPISKIATRVTTSWRSRMSRDRLSCRRRATLTSRSGSMPSLHRSNP